MKRLVALLALICAMQVHADPIHAQVVVQDTCVNWSTYPAAAWTNTTGQTLAIAEISMGFAGADHIVGEIALWVDRVGRPTAATAPLNRMYSFGVEVYVPPSQAITREVSPPTDSRYTILPGEGVSLMVNCGPILHGSQAFQPFVYFGEITMTLVPVSS